MTDDERIERALKSIGDTYVRENPPNFPAFREGVIQRQRRRRWFQAGSAVALAGATVAIGLFFSRSAPLDKPQAPAGREVERAVTDKVPVGDTPSQINVGHNAVWVTSKSGSVTRIDPVTKEPITRDVGGLPTDLAVGDSGVWIVNNGTLQRLALDGEGGVREIEITDDATARMHVSIAPRAIWVVTGQEIYKVDPAGGKTLFPAVQSPVDIAVGDGELWALDLGGRIYGYDVKSGKAKGAPIDVKTGANAEITLGSGALWYGVKGDTTFMRIDLLTRETATVELPSAYVDMGIGKEEVWVLMAGAADTGIFASADLATGELGRNHVAAGAPVDIAVGRQALWIVNATSDRALRIQKSLLAD